MIAPTKAGKTSLLSAIFQEIKDRLAGNQAGIQYNAADQATKNAVDRALAEFNTCVAADVFGVPNLAGSQDVFKYEFAFSIPTEAGPQRININVMDYPGGLLGTPEFEDKVGLYLTESSVLLVPIPADILMEWKRTSGSGSKHNMDINISAQMMLDNSNVVSGIQDWLERRKKAGKKSLLIFTPIRCEAYFEDNGGLRDESKSLHEAVKALYVDALTLSPEMKDLIQIETHAVDTYGIVELRDISLITNETGEFLESKFRRRLREGKKIKPRGAFEIIATVIRFKLNEYAQKLGMDRKSLEEVIKKRTFFNSFLKRLFGDPEKKLLAQYMSQNDAAFQAMEIMSSLKNDYPARQKVLNEIKW